MRHARRLLPLFVLTALHASASSWTLRPAFAAEIGYDDNVFLQDRSALLPAVANPVPDEAASGFLKTSASLAATYKAGDSVFTAGYTAELTRYEAFASENHDDHRLELASRGHSANWSHAFKGSLLVVSGENTSPAFGHAGGTPAIGGADLRARRDQAYTKFSGNLTRTLNHGFVRAVTAANIQDYHTHHLAAPGYANYVDRAEYTAGLEGARNVHKDFALVAAVRGGFQRQADLLGVAQNSSNTLTRVLVGVEGRPHADLKLAILAGPDFRRYDSTVPAGFDRTRTARYVEASATWTPCKTDTVTFTAKDYLWLSSGGRLPYQNTAAALAWEHAFTAEWSVTLASDIEVGDNRDYVLPASRRCDWIYTGTFTVTRQLGANTTLDLSLTREWSDSVIAATPGREYTRLLTRAGVTHTF